MIDPSANSRESHSDCSGVDTCKLPQDPRSASTTAEHNVIDREVTCRSGIPADVAYIEALGRCFYHFSYLEWIVVSITAKLHQDAYASFTKPKTAGYLARKLMEAIAAASPSLTPSLRQRLAQFHRAFVTAKHRRDKLLKAAPYAAKHNLSQMGASHHAWPTAKLDGAAGQFEEIANEGAEILHRISQVQRDSARETNELGTPVSPGGARRFFRRAV